MTKEATMGDELYTEKALEEMLEWPVDAKHGYCGDVIRKLIRTALQALAAKERECGELRAANSAANKLIGEGAEECKRIVESLESRLDVAEGRAMKAEFFGKHEMKFIGEARYCSVCAYQYQGWNERHSWTPAQWEAEARKAREGAK